MRAVVQRVSRASVTVNGQAVGEIGRGLVALVGIESTDQPADRAWMADKVVNLRIFEDAAGKMNMSLLDLAAAVAAERPGLLLIPNFTLAGDARRGRRPSFDSAMKPEASEPEFNRLIADIRSVGASLSIQTGIFRADMQVSLINDGPVTIYLDSRATG